MDWKKVVLKGGLGILTFMTGFAISNPKTVVDLIPEKISQMTVGSIVAGLLVALANWLKHRKDAK